MLKSMQVLTIFIAAFFFSIPAVDAEQTITVKGFAYSVEKPDIAIVIIKTTGKGKDYNESAARVEENVAEIVSHAKSILLKDILPTTIKTESKPLSIGIGNLEGYEQEYFQKMAQAMKGETPKTTKKKKEPVYVTTKYIYFSINDYSANQLNEFKNTLASKELAFNEKTDFEFMASFELNKSYILYGVQDPYKHLENLTKSAYENAKIKALSTAKAVDKTLGNLISIEKSCNDIEGDIDISTVNKLLGKQLGPLSSDPTILPLEYSLKFIFEMN